MDLQISVFLLFSLFTAGHSINCYECASGTCSQTICSGGFTNCTSFSYAVNTNKVKLRGCIPARLCLNGFVSFGALKVSSSCCNTDLCNSKDAPEPSITPNGKKCYSCDGIKMKNCTNVLSCSGTEDRCFKATDADQTVVIKGCATKSVCDAAAAAVAVAAVISGVKIVNASCCEGELCNGAQSVSQSFLFLCCSLLSYFLLH